MYGATYPMGGGPQDQPQISEEGINYDYNGNQKVKSISKEATAAPE